MTKFGIIFTSSKFLANIPLSKPAREKVAEVSTAKSIAKKGDCTVTLSIKKLATINTQSPTTTPLVIQASTYPIIILFFEIGDTRSSSKLLNILAEKNQKAVIAYAHIIILIISNPGKI